MGFVRKNIMLEEYLDTKGIEWEMITDSTYKKIYKAINEIIESEERTICHGDEAFEKLNSQLPFEAYIFSAPRTNHLFAIYYAGGSNAAFGYKVINIKELERGPLNNIECVVANTELTFACSLNHEWQGHCPEVYVENI